MPKEAKNKEKKVKQVKQKNHFVKDTKAELKKVIWPTPKQLLNNTLAVILIVVLIGVIVFVLDLCFDKINAYGIDKLKQAVQSNTTNSQEVENSEQTNELEVNAETASDNTSTQATEGENTQAVENAE